MVCLPKGFPYLISDKFFRKCDIVYLSWAYCFLQWEYPVVMACCINLSIPLGVMWTQTEVLSLTSGADRVVSQRWMKHGTSIFSRFTMTMFAHTTTCIRCVRAIDAILSLLFWAYPELVIVSSRHVPASRYRYFTTVGKGMDLGTMLVPPPYSRHHHDITKAWRDGTALSYSPIIEHHPFLSIP